MLPVPVLPFFPVFSPVIPSPPIFSAVRLEGKAPTPEIASNIQAGTYHGKYHGNFMDNQWDTPMSMNMSHPCPDSFCAN